MVFRNLRARDAPYFPDPTVLAAVGEGMVRFVNIRVDDGRFSIAAVDLRLDVSRSISKGRHDIRAIDPGTSMSEFVMPLV